MHSTHTIESCNEACVSVGNSLALLWQCVAVCRSWLRVLQCVAMCCSVLQYFAVWRSVLQCVAVCRSVSRCVAACCSQGGLRQSSCALCAVVAVCAVCFSVLQYDVVCCKKKTVVQCDQCVAVCCSVLQCVAACCSVLQCVREAYISVRVFLALLL